MNASGLIDIARLSHDSDASATYERGPDYRIDVRVHQCPRGDPEYFIQVIVVLCPDKLRGDFARMQEKVNMLSLLGAIGYSMECRDGTMICEKQVTKQNCEDEFAIAREMVLVRGVQ